tara:strand:- start:8397 stop:8924 length:528 start_codon:yes stop_codon:yes gene_type:complete
MNDMTSQINTLVESAKALKEAGYDIRALLEDAGVFKKINKYRELDVRDLQSRYDLRATVEQIGPPSYVAKWGKPAECRGNIYKKNGDLVKGGWNGAKTYRTVQVTGKTFSGKIVQRNIQFHTVAFALHNGRWPETPVVDHADDNKLNNYGDNLTEKDYTTNQWMRKANDLKKSRV